LAPAPPPPNLPAGLPTPGVAESFGTLLAGAGSRVERIASPRGHASPPGFWYEGSADDWALLLSGSAWLTFADSAEPADLSPGSRLHLPARRRHRRRRVDRTAPDRPTVWLAIRYAAGAPTSACTCSANRGSSHAPA
jgi:cupin 2 domain-containing protein